MSQSILYGNPYYVLLSLGIMCFASYTMISMIGQLKPGKDVSQSRLTGAALVFTLGLWTMHVVSLLASDYMLVIDLSSILTFIVCAVAIYIALRILHRQPAVQWLSKTLCAIIIALGATVLHYLSILSNSVSSFSIDPLLFILSFAVSFAGSYAALTILKVNLPLNKVISSLLFGLSNMAMYQISMHAITVEYSFVLTTDRMNDFLTLLALILCMTTVLILSFSLTAWSSMRKYAMIDERYKLLVDNSTDTIALIKDGKWEYMNPSGLGLFEAGREKELIGVSIYLLLQEEYHDTLADWLADDGCDDMAAGPIELIWSTMSGKLIHTEMVRVRATYFGSTIEQVIIRDISERKKKEEMFVNAEKLSIAGQLAAGIAHEIRNPLTSLKGFMQLIASGKIQNNRYYPIMQSELQRIESIISELLMLSKPQVYEFAYIDLRQLIMESINSLHAQARLYDVNVTHEFLSGPLWVHGVENQLKQVFINLLKNAIESMPGGGTIRIELSLDEEETINVRISDEGCGMPVEQLTNLGQPFYTTKDKGTGLGLMVTFKIIDNHKGHISAESEVNVGTTFTIRLPHRCPAASKLAMMNQHV